MALINRLSITGIRSFGVETTDTQKIEFSTPLTLIVGENGCGKTTIIECLKYALTGETPPGSDRGKNFIHESKSQKNRTSFMGRVRLTISDIRGNEITVTRQMKMEYLKTGKSKFETLNSSISFLKAGTSKREDHSGRVEDTNNYMCNAMGVSKAIINNVIFCHQEDSNWPLDEGKKLKEKFDAIFGTTEYNKAFDKLAKIRKVYQDDLREIKVTIKLNEEISNQVEKKERDLRELKVKHEGLQIKFQEFDRAIVPLEEKKQNIMEKEANYGKLVAEKLKFENTIKNKSTESKNLREKIEKTGKLEEDMKVLQQKQENFERDKNMKKKNMESYENECKKLKIKKLEKERSSYNLSKKVDSCTDKYQTLQNLIANRFDKAKEICTKLKIPFTEDPDQSINTQEINGTLNDIDKSISERNNQLIRLKSVADEEDATYQHKVDNLREERTKLETNITTQHQSIKSLNENMLKINDEIKESEQSIPMLNRIKPKIDELESKYKKLSDENKVDDLKDQQDMIRVEKIELEDRLSTLEDDIEKLHSISKITTELDSKNAELIKDQKEFDRIKNKSASNFKLLFPSQTISTNFRALIMKRQKELEDEINAAKSQLEKIRRENDSMKNQRINLRKQEQNKDEEIKKIESNIDELCGGRDYYTLLNSQRDKVDKLKMELAVLQSSKNTYLDYIEKIKETPCCPLCHKDFEHDESDNLQVELEGNIDQLPRKISDIQNKLKVETKKFDKLNGFKSSYESNAKLKEEKAQIAQELKELDKKLNVNDELREDLEATSAEPTSLLSMITGVMIAEMIKLDELQRTINMKSSHVEDLKSKIPIDMPKIKLEEAQAQRKEINENFKLMSANEKKIVEEINSYQNQMMNVREELNNLIAKRNQYQEKMQGIDRLKEQLKEMKLKKVELEEKLKTSQSKFQPIQVELSNVLKKKQESRDANNKKITQQQRLIDELKVDKNEIDRLSKEIAMYEEMNLEQSIHDLSEALKKEKETVKNLNIKIQNREETIQAFRDELNKGQVTLYNILDNINLLKLEDDVEAEMVNLRKLKKTMGELDYEKMSAEKKKIIYEIERITKERSMLSGQETQIEERIEGIEKELNDKKYKNAKNIYLESQTRETVLTAVIDDLKTYANALEKALLKFHQEKMNEINALIRELWNNVYKGNDIDYIMIKTDEDTASNTDKRRSYNYRVMQCKLNGDLTEMRGRCSAGQKVLASLIIRIALADTFSSECGILALDEPTTNLDQANVKSLSLALAELVAQRSDGRFMLIIITHDENFVENLEQTEKYYRISRNNNGLSVINEIS